MAGNSSTQSKLTIANGQTISSHLTCGDWSGGSIHFDSGMDGATMIFQTANDIDSSGRPTNWGAAYDAGGSAIGNVTVPDSCVVPINPLVFQARFFRIVSATAETPAKTLTVQLKG